MMKRVDLKRLARAAAAGALVLSLAACGGAGEDAATTETVVEETADDVEIANPWSDVASAEEAASVAGLVDFSDGAGSVSRLGAEYYVTYSATSGLAEATIEYPACELCVRKGTPVEGDDVSGDYNTYAHTWTAQVGDVTLACAGNREGESQRTIWTKDGYDYSITTLGLGGDQAFGLLEADLAEMVPNVR